MTVDGAVIEALSQDLSDTEDVACEAFRQSVSWRHVALMALAGYAEQQQRADRLENRLRQTMGIDPWHPEQES